MHGRMAFTPRQFQANFLQDRSRRRLVVKARQIGFSQVIALEAVHEAITERDATILLVSRNGDLAANLLAYCHNAIAALTDVPDLIKANESDLVFGNGSRVLSLPANPATGRGFAGRSVYLDEYAYQDYAQQIYQSVSPILGHGGRLTVCSTPNGVGNHFYQLFAGIDGGEWSRHIVPWYECPVYDQAWYDRERPNYTAQQWASEYECDFVASGQAVFRLADIEACADGWIGFQSPRSDRQYVTAWDIGRRQDATVGITLDVTSGTLQVVAFDRLLGASYPVIQATIEQRGRDYSGPVFVESNGIGDPVIENLSIAVEPFVTTSKTKWQAITALALAHENHRLKHDIRQLTLETQLYQVDDSKLIQDCVMAAAIAVFSAAESGPLLLWGE